MQWYDQSANIANFREEFQQGKFAIANTNRSPDFDVVCC
jgi:hypothetical protein